MVKLNLVYGLIGKAIIGGAGSAGVYFSLRQPSKEVPKKETVEP